MIRRDTATRIACTDLEGQSRAEAVGFSFVAAFPIGA